MNVSTSPGSPAPLARPIEDPLGEDAPGDVVVVTTRRALCRIACVGAEVGSRFQRESVDVDPVAWMLAPRRLFGGAAALDACLGRDAFARATLLHGLSLGMDAAPADVDELLDADADADDDEDVDGGGGRGRDGAAEDRGGDGARGSPDASRLHTALLWTKEGEGYRHAFHASLALSTEAFRERVREVLGDGAAMAVVQPGVDASSPVVAALVGPVMLDLLGGAAGRVPPALAAVSLTIDFRMGA